jgi:hypothetical protein
MSISQLYPAEGPTLNLNFAGSRTLDPRITFTRTQTTSNGSTYTGRDGLIKYAGPNEPRFDHRYVNGEIESLGLLIEEQRVNSALRSQEFNLSPNLAVNASISPNSAIAPDGTLTADKLVEDNISSIYKRVQQGGFTVSGDYTVSFFVKEAGRYRGYIQLLNTTNASVSFNLQNETVSGVVQSRSKIEKYPNGWYRISTSNTFNAGETPTVYIVMLNDSGSSNYVGDGSSGLFIWGLQVEAGAFPTSYIPTEGSTKTRNADNASITGSNFTEWYNPSEGTLFVKAESFAAPTELTAVASLNVPSSYASNRIDIRYQQGGVSYCFFNGEAALTRPSGFSLSNPKFIAGYKQNTQKFSTNGSLASASASFTPSPNITHLQIGTFDNFSYELNGCISQLSYYPFLLTDNQLITLTR